MPPDKRIAELQHRLPDMQRVGAPDQAWPGTPTLFVAANQCVGIAESQA
jgi:hypothetical protein